MRPCLWIMVSLVAHQSFVSPVLAERRWSDVPEHYHGVTCRNSLPSCLVAASRLLFIDTLTLWHIFCILWLLKNTSSITFALDHPWQHFILHGDVSDFYQVCSGLVCESYGKTHVMSLSNLGLSCAGEMRSWQISCLSQYSTDVSVWGTTCSVLLKIIRSLQKMAW
jgi:hypothetical protein